MIKSGKILLLIVSSLFLFQCENDFEDPNEKQLIKDKQIIADYVATNNLQGVYIQDIYKTTLEEGSGTEYPKANEGIKLSYVLEFLDGRPIDSTKTFYQQDQLYFPAGWESAVRSMKEGEMASFLFPSLYLYGNSSAQRGNIIIPPNSVLRLKAKLLDIIPSESIPEALAEEKNLPNPVKTESKMVYSITTQGNGPEATKGKTVTVKYKGFLLNGYSFDESNAFVFVAGTTTLIKGWNEAISLMRKGDRGTFILPSDLAYGVGGSVRNNRVVIPPNAVIYFDIEVLDVQ